MIAELPLVSKARWTLKVQGSQSKLNKFALIGIRVFQFLCAYLCLIAGVFKGLHAFWMLLKDELALWAATRAHQVCLTSEQACLKSVWPQLVPGSVSLG